MTEKGAGMTEKGAGMTKKGDGNDSSEVLSAVVIPSKEGIQKI
ncbi:MAG: hypothetical protein SFT93_05255 [Rickettsiaceae bacterium]|nr:hypothetical protein [Rickettsiaceae bacterium]